VSGEVVGQDQGGWISGPSISTEQILAQDVETGDRLVYDGRVIEISDVNRGFYYLRDGREQGLAIGWKSGNSSGLLFRHVSDLLERNHSGLKWVAV
jgi:hypothetical protein